ncbi:MAG TPA: zf-HC2 domain-containing protein [Gemmatimonadota bacterium]|nr:zf-HC2 domain-containing protein [Gemmatimonadota bacterium]
MTCPETRDRLSAYVDGELPPAEAEALGAHLAACAACARAERSERALLDRVAAGGRTVAPEALRRRVEAIVAGSREGGSRRGLRWALPLAAAAGAAALLLFFPPAPENTVAAGLAADHTAHAATHPSGHPFPPGAEPPAIPGPEDARIEGLSDCTVDGLRYAHWVAVSGEARVSVFVPLDESPPVGSRLARAGGVSVVAVHGEGGVEAFLVSSDLPPAELAARWGA